MKGHCSCGCNNCSNLGDLETVKKIAIPLGIIGIIFFLCVRD